MTSEDAASEEVVDDDSTAVEVAAADAAKEELLGADADKSEDSLEVEVKDDVPDPSARAEGVEVNTVEDAFAV